MLKQIIPIQLLDPHISAIKHSRHLSLMTAGAVFRPQKHTFSSQKAQKLNKYVILFTLCVDQRTIGQLRQPQDRDEIYDSRKRQYRSLECSHHENWQRRRVSVIISTGDGLLHHAWHTNVMYVHCTYMSVDLNVKHIYTNRCLIVRMKE